LSESTSPVSAPSPDRAEVSFIEVDGVRLRVSVRGRGFPVLLITGLGAALELSRPFERELCGYGFQVISFDAPGIGRSTPYRGPRRMPGLARTVEQLVVALGHDSLDVVGVSLGGVVAQQLAHQAPHRVRRLVLAATAPGLGGVPGDPRVLAHLMTPRRYSEPEYFRRIAGTIYGGAHRRAASVQAPYSLDWSVQRPSLRGYLGQLYAITAWTSLPWLRRLPQCTLVLAGDDDPIVPLVNGRILAALIGRARLHVVAGGGHLFLLDRAAEVAFIVAAFLHEDVPSCGP
jgi:poly(3-hydroxyalkanoate) depolymerase